MSGRPVGESGLLDQDARADPFERGVDVADRDRSDVHLVDYVKVLYKRRWSALTAFLVVVLVASVHTFSSVSMYDARVQILIEKEDANVVTFKEVFAQNQITADYYQTQYRILQSRALARRTIDALHLWDHPQFNPRPDDSLTVRALISMPVKVVRRWVRSSAPGEPPLPDETRKQSSTIDRFLDGLTVSPIRDSRLVDLRYRSPDPELSARVANGLAKGYIEQNLEFKFSSSKEASDWLEQQLAEQRTQVEATEHALQLYRESNDAVSLEERQNIVVQKLTDLNAAVTRAKTERIQKEAAYQQIRAVQSDRAALDTLPAIVANAFVQQQKGELANLERERAQLSETLGPRHPDMLKLGLAIETAEAKISTEIATVVESMRNDYEQALAQEKSLNSALGQQKLEALELNRKGIEYGVLARDAAANRQVFESLMQRTKETGISGELRTSNIRIVDAAEIPRSPSAPNTRNDLLLALLGGAAFAIGLTFFLEYVDNRIKSPDEVKQYLGLSFLGMVPALFDKTIENPMINNGVPGIFSESFRALRSNLLFSSAEEGGRSLVVTSTGPGEGKTVVATNIAMALAQTGERVLLVDADMRRPRVHEVFGRPQKPGLSNVLVGDAKASEVVHDTAVSGLSVIPAGVNPPNPAELLGSKRFKDLVAALPEQFDWVIIDTPPVMAVTDSSIVAHLATGVLFIVGAEMTARNAAVQAIEQLAHAHARFLGAVLNRVDVQHNPYYYSQYYRREYGSYYQNARA
jgi:capsular exopolysaccharide synthesis family protein